MLINAQKIYLHMAKKELTVAALASIMGMSRQALSVIIRRGTCTPPTAARIARGLGVEIEQIVGEG